MNRRAPLGALGTAERYVRQHPQRTIRLLQLGGKSATAYKVELFVEERDHRHSAALRVAKKKGEIKASLRQHFADTTAQAIDDLQSNARKRLAGALE